MGLEVPTLTVVGDVYQLVWPESGIEMTMDRLAESKDGIQSEITVALTFGPTPGLLHYAKLNLLSTQTRGTLVKTLSSRSSIVDWGTALEQACLLVVSRYRTGEPVIDLREVDLTQATRWRIRPFVEDAAATILFADGGSGKSLFALALGVTQATGHPVLGELIGEPGAVLYLDWEADEVTHAERLAAVVEGAKIREGVLPVLYRRMVASLKEAAPYVRRDIAQHHVKLVIVDSLGAAKGGEPEGADSSIALFSAARSFGVPWIGIDHVTKAASSPTSGKGRPYGSTYTHNLARLTWSLEQADEQTDTGFAVALTNHKRNNGRTLPRQAYRITMANYPESERLQCVHFEPVNIKTETGLVEKLPLHERILAHLQRRPLPVTYAELYEQFPGEDKAVIRSRMNDLKNKGKVIQVPGERWGLIG